jgi:hypothetical protein
MKRTESYEMVSWLFVQKTVKFIAVRSERKLKEKKENDFLFEEKRKIISCLRTPPTKLNDVDATPTGFN